MPAGVREIGATWYWQPTSARERAERKEKGLPGSVTLGPAGSTAARRKWAEVSGFREVEAKEGTVGELLQLWLRDGILTKPDGKPRAAPTVRSYRYAAPAVLARFGETRYGKSNLDAARGRAIGPADIQRFVRSCSSKSMGNLYLAVLNNAFVHAIGEGLTVYNPCEDVFKNGMYARTRAPLPWEFECLRTLARPLVGLVMDYEKITGDRINEVLAILRAHGTAEGVRVHRSKGGKPEVWTWSPELRRIWEEAARLPGATPFPKSPLFPGRRGRPFTYSGFNTAWQALKLKTNRALAGGVIDPDTLTARGALAIEDLHFHDWRSKVHDDAEDQKAGSGHKQIGDTREIADRHYARRDRKKPPLE